MVHEGIASVILGPLEALVTLMDPLALSMVAHNPLAAPIVTRDEARRTEVELTLM